MFPGWARLPDILHSNRFPHRGRFPVHQSLWVVVGHGLAACRDQIANVLFQGQSVSPLALTAAKKSSAPRVLWPTHTVHRVAFGGSGSSQAMKAETVRTLTREQKECVPETVSKSSQRSGAGWTFKRGDEGWGLCSVTVHLLFHYLFPSSLPLSPFCHPLLFLSSMLLVN